MPLPKLARAAAFFAAAVALVSFAPTGAEAQKKAQSKPADRPKRPDLPPSSLPLALLQGERIALVGNSTAERMNLFGHFETMLQTRFAGRELVVRNFGWPADEVGLRQRPSDYTRLGDPLAAFGADTMDGFMRIMATTTTVR